MASQLSGCYMAGMEIALLRVVTDGFPLLKGDLKWIDSRSALAPLLFNS